MSDILGVSLFKLNRWPSRAERP